MMQSRGNYIAGAWVLAQGEKLVSHSPSTGEILWSGKSATEQEVNSAVQAAKNAFSSWRQLSFQERESHLERFKSLLLEEKKLLAHLLSKENGKPLWEALNEITAMANKIDISIAAQKMRCPLSEQIQGQYHNFTRHRPWGIAAILGPFNFPGHLPNGHIIPALLAGNCVVFKPSELTPAFGEATAKLWEKAQLPAGVFNLVQGESFTGEKLATHPQINMLLFTGSYHVGKILANKLADHPEKILALEMGGNNPLVVTKVSDLRAAAYTIIQSAFLSSGQRCSCCRRLILVKNSSTELLLRELVHMSKKISVGHFDQVPEPFMGPLINEKAAGNVFEKYQSLVSQGAKIYLPMQKLSLGAAFLSPGIVDVTNIAEKEDSEIFGPLIQVTFVDNFDIAIEEANNTRYGLCAGLLSDDKEEYELFLNTVNAGVINFNAPLTGASSAAPFGGIGFSGNGRPSAFYAADYCNYPVASMEANSLQLPEKITPGIAL